MRCLHFFDGMITIKQLDPIVRNQIAEEIEKLDIRWYIAKEADFLVIEPYCQKNSWDAAAILQKELTDIVDIVKRHKAIVSGSVTWHDEYKNKGCISVENLHITSIKTSLKDRIIMSADTSQLAAELERRGYKINKNL